MRNSLSLFFYDTYDYFWRSADSLFQVGTSIYERDWELLILLDGCRYDTFESVKSGYPYLGTNKPIYSVGSSSKTWMGRTFTHEYREEQSVTAYVTGNPYSRRLLDDEMFAVVDHIWEYAWDDETGTIYPQPITDRAIDIWRSKDPGRMIVHYMQPHYPFLNHPELHEGIDLDYFGNQPTDSVWACLRSNEANKPEVKKAYRENLEIVLDNIKTLVENISAESTVLTADHGNAFGEFGQYGHPNHTLNPYVRKVPWCRIETVDNHTYEPSLDPGPERNNLESKLEDLGYL